ncbi:hypothetical protein ACFPOI_58710 [Nonomuraea angiospora]|uniref:Uncharacterized protein n=1 Tax=Nonomuraea angiospora TaxID=46172 RepID=A0ABR9LRX7_9ACTN|nr:hypothetical protein [Nonomuraea angiospora]MBE1583017.1 hypothetical protein [Nonomuraea angiospora]
MADEPTFPLGRPISFTWAPRGRPPRNYVVREPVEAWTQPRLPRRQRRGDVAAVALQVGTTSSAT